MKIKVNDKITVDVQVTQTYVCPAGTAYWQIDYMVDGVCIHSATTGAIHGNPDVIAMLDRKYSYEVNLPSKPTTDESKGRKIHEWHGNNNSVRWTEEFETTHRDAIIKAYSQLVIE